MALSVNWGTYVITVPKADMTVVATTPSEIRQLNINDFRLELRDIEDSIPGIPQPVTHEHDPPTTLSGVTYARLVRMLAPYTIEFEDDLYNVNITGGNSNISDVVVKNQVGVNTANSAGLQDASSLQAASFFGYVTVKPSAANTGTTFPVGTREFPVNNLTDALTIAEERGLHTILFVEDATLTSNDFSNGYEFRGDSPVNVTLTLNPGADVTNCQFTSLTVNGTLDGMNTFRQCHIHSVNFFNGAIHECSIEGTIVCGGSSLVEIYDSWSGVPGGGAGQTPVLQMDGSNDLVVRGYDGGIEITNLDYAMDGSIDLDSGRVVIDSSCTNGTLYIRGVATVSDFSAGATVVDQTATPATIADAVWDEPAADHVAAGSMGLLLKQAMQSAVNAFASIWAK